MNYERDVLREVSERLASAGIKFMVTGSVAMGYYAEPRMTRDIDLVVALMESDVERVVRLFEQDYYIDEQAVARAIAHRSVFNIIHTEKVVKADFIILKADPYQQEEFARRRLVEMGEFQTWIIGREDLILSKICWAKVSRSEMLLRDVRNLLASGYDERYLRSHAEALGVQDLLVSTGNRMNDTSPEVAALMREMLMARSGAERVLMCCEMFETARALAFASFPPRLPEIEVKRRLCERFYGKEVDVEAFIEYVRSRSKERERLATEP